MIARALPWLAALAVGSMTAGAIDLRERSESGNKQFIVYSEDVRLRQRAASYAEGVKTDVLQLLGVKDSWKAPIVITFAQATPRDLGEPPVLLRMAETEPGFKIELQVKIGVDPSEVNLHKALLRAVLIEYAYRRVGIKAGQKIVEAPWWIIEGLYEMARRREQGADSAVFQRLIETNRLPPIDHFVAEKPGELGPTAMAVDRALAMCLLELLIKQPDGRMAVGRLLRDWPQSNGDPAAVLAKNFPELGSGPVLQKWWTLNLARFAAADRYQGLTVEETDKALSALLQVEVTVSEGEKGKDEKKTFPITDYAQLLKVPGSREALTNQHTEIVALSTKANAVFRPVIADYGEIIALLARGKTRGIKGRLAKAEEYRQRALRRVSDISDYLNWFEATQMQSRSGVFDDYLKTAREISEQDRKQKSLVGKYLDELEKEL